MSYSSVFKCTSPRLHCTLLNGPYGDSAAVKLKTQGWNFLVPRTLLLILLIAML